MAEYSFAANSTAVLAKAGGTLTGGLLITDAGNVGIGEDDLMTFSVAANTLAVDGDRLEVEAVFALTANANNKTIKFYFGAANTYSTGALAINNGIVVIRATVVRTGAATQRILVTAASNNALLTTALLAAYGTVTETLSGAVTLKFTGEATADNDIVQKFMSVAFYPKA